MIVQFAQMLSALGMLSERQNQESPGFRVLSIRMTFHWKSFLEHVLQVESSSKI